MTMGPGPWDNPGGSSVFLSAAQWVQTVLLGPLSTSIAVIAVASIGLLMLSGRMNIRRGATVILGCFILFGAASIAGGLRGMAGSFTGDTPRPEPVMVQPAIPIELLSPPSNPAVGSADPYAGAAVRR